MNLPMIIGGNPGQAKSTLKRLCVRKVYSERASTKTHFKHSSGPASLSAKDAEPLRSLLFSVLQVLLILSALQPSIFSVLANGGQIACSPPFSSKIRSQGKHMGFPSLFQDEQEAEVSEERILDWK